MCRHLAYLGEPLAIRRLVLDPPMGLYRQSWAPRLQQYGSVNVDGFGVGWYAEHDPVPARYRRAGPIWADDSFADLARVVRTGALLAAVRSATDGCAAGEAAAAPFAAERWLFSHNGALPGWPHQLGKLAGTLPPEELLSLAAGSDSALLWALALHRLHEGARLDTALADTVRETAGHCPEARLNLLLTDGTSIAATAWGDTLCYRTGPSSVVVASEPYDDLPGWVHPPDRSLLLATPDGVTVRSIN
ncbi:ergothioneine biosynthesis protein EgtC [Kitasatospora sp. GP82]|uniref:ergothioneine biosynthesis protein EgtC n=1 Tax=Kitasatospora sp. GP82 TaxID=3035089 RepID=UPI0024751DA7|nr:ergothioneine biosynthesis protein EgtC [Kitasatospora sp. GP82]MDH6125352.1 glutamine amidotransferase [Kitasatospora sp. GP82]